MDKKIREDYINSAPIGAIVAFKNEDNVYSGRIAEIQENLQTNHKRFVIKTKNGSVYFVEQENIIWVKTGSHWPNGVFNALKYSRK